MEEKYIKLSDAKKAIEDYRSEVNVSKYGSLEACMDAKFAVTGAMKELDYIPPADVVPRAEYEKVVINMNAYGLAAKRLQEDIERLQELNNRQVEDIRLAKAEVAREIFEEVETVLKTRVRRCVNEDGVITPLQDTCWTIEIDDYAQIKKKYTEGGDNAT